MTILPSNEITIRFIKDNPIEIDGLERLSEEQLEDLKTIVELHLCELEYIRHITKLKKKRDIVQIVKDHGDSSGKNQIMMGTLIEEAAKIGIAEREVSMIVTSLEKWSDIDPEKIAFHHLVKLDYARDRGIVRFLEKK